MKNPENFPWKNHLPEHLPKENLWEKMLARKSLDGQVGDLKSQLPLSYPKEDLWIDIEKSLNKRKTIVFWRRVVSVAAVLMVGLWGVIALFDTTAPTETMYLTTEISKEIGKSIPEIRSISIPETEKEIKPETGDQNRILQIDPVKKIEIPELENKELFQVEIPLPKIFFAEVERRDEESDEFPAASYQGKKTIAITWDKQPKLIKIDGFSIELTEKERKLIKELENRKKGKFNLHVNALTARLYEK